MSQYLSATTHLTIYEQLDPINLKSSDNYITIVSDRVVDFSDFKYKVLNGLLTTNNVGYWEYNTYSTYNILPNPNSFLIYNPSVLLNLSENITINEFNNINDNYLFGIIECKEESRNIRNEEEEVIYSKPYFLIFGEENEDEEFDYNNYILNSTDSRFLTDYERKRYFDDYTHCFITMFNGSGYTNQYTPSLDDPQDPFRMPLFDLEINNNNDRFYFEVWDQNGQAFRAYIENKYVNDNTKLLLNIDINRDFLKDEIAYVTEVYNGSWSSTSDVIGGSEDLILDTTKKFYFYTTNDSDVRTSKRYLFERKACDNLLDDIYIVWNNRLGGTESYIFKGNVNKEIEVEKNYYSNTKYNIDPDTGKLDRGFNDKDKSVSSKSKNITYEITTKYKDTREGELFIDLINSNNVYVVENGDLIPIIIDTDSIEFGDRAVDPIKIFNFKFKKNIRKNNKKY